MTFRFAGFRDAHCHPLFAGREALGPDVTHATSITEVQQILEDFAAKNPQANWIDCGSYDRNIAGPEGFLASQIDEVISHIPVVIHASDHHTIWVNTQALKVAGLLDQVPKLEVGSVDIDDLGQASGVLREWDAMNLVYVHQPALTPEQELQALDWAQRQLLSLGVVGMQDAWLDPGMERVYLDAVEQNRLLIPTNLAPRLSPDSSQKDYEFALEVRRLVGKTNSPLLTCNTVKLFADGVFGSNTAAVKEAYCNHTAKPFGEPLWTSHALNQLAIKADTDGFQLHIHAIGDAGVAMAIDAIAAAIDANPVWDRRPVIAHVELIDDTDLERMAALGITAIMQPLWARRDGLSLSCLPALGEERFERLYRGRDLLERGVRVAMGSDWPVSSPDPLLGVYTAVSRRVDADAQPLGLDQAITAAQALQAYSTDAAWVLQQEHLLQRDWVELSADPAGCATEDLRNIRVLAASVAGVEYRF